MPHEIHTSTRKSFKTCRRRWDWVYNEKYYPIVTAKPLEFGIAYHAAMEVYYNPDTWDWDRQVVGELAKLRFREVCEEQKKRFLELKDETYLDDDVEADYEERLELGIGMLTYYFEVISPPLDKAFRPVKVEIAFSVPIHDPNGNPLLCTCHPEGDNQVVYDGRIDMLAEDVNGEYWIFDWKTAARISASSEFLQLDDQVGSYVWALVKKLRLPVRGFVYVEQKKGYPKPPKKNASVRLGRAYSVAQNQDTDYDIYLATVSTEDAAAFEAGLYDDFLAYLKAEGTQFYSRFQINKTAKELEEIGKNIYLEARDMVAPDLAIYPNSGKFSCSWCAFREPCIGKNSGEDYLYTLNTLFEKKERHYYEEEAPSVESDKEAVTS